MYHLTYGPYMKIYDHMAVSICIHQYKYEEQVHRDDVALLGGPLGPRGPKRAWRIRARPNRAQPIRNWPIRAQPIRPSP